MLGDVAPLSLHGIEIECMKQLFRFDNHVNTDAIDARVNDCRGCAWSIDGRYFAWSCGNRKVKVIAWNQQVSRHGVPTVEGARRALTIDTDYLVQSLAFCSRTPRTTYDSTDKPSFHYVHVNDVTLAIGLKNGRIRTYDVTTGALKLELCDHTAAVTDMSFAPSGPLLLVSASMDGTLKVWDLDDDGNMIKTLKNTCSHYYGCRWAPDGKTLAAVGNFQSVQLWDMKTKTLRHRLQGHHNNVAKCDFSPDGALLATASYDSRVIVWDVQNGTPLTHLHHCYPPLSPIYAGGANGSYVRSVAFSHDGHHIATTCDDGYIRLWDLFDAEFPVLVAPVDAGLVCNFSPNGQLLAVAGASGHVSLWMVPSEVASLQHLCRMTIRRLIPSDKLDSLVVVPRQIRSYLRYNRVF